MSVISTEMFDIVFVNECAASAKAVAERCDGFYRGAARKFNLRKNFRMPIVITPDSDTLSVSYSPLPFNRIVVYDAPPSSTSSARDESLLARLEREITRAVVQSIRSPFIQAASTLFSDVLQPSYLLNMPLSFFEGVSATGGKDGQVKMTDDIESLQLLAQAKMDGKFPSYTQAAGARDIYPGGELARQAGSAFAAYIQQRWGVARYAELWRQAGRLHLFKLHAGIFKKVYGESLRDAWKDFERAIPLPAFDEASRAMMLSSSSVMGREGGCLPSLLAARGDDVIFFDEARSEVAAASPGGKRKKLFSAVSVTALSLSADGALLAVSIDSEGTRENFVKRKALIYDMEKRKFLKETYRARDCALSPDGRAIAGIEARRDRAELCVFERSRGKKHEKIFSRSFPPGAAARSVFFARENIAGCVVSWKGENCLLEVDIESGEETLTALPRGKTGRAAAAGEKIAVSFIPQDEMAFSRAAIVSIGEDGFPRALSLMARDIPGGAADCAIVGENLAYISSAAFFRSIRSVPLEKIPFVESEAREADVSIPFYDDGGEPKIEKRKVILANGKQKEKKFLGGYEAKKYNPAKYLMKGTLVPLFPLWSFSIDETYRLSPGIGATYLAQSDAFDWASGALSFGMLFLDPDDSYTSFINDFSVSAFVKLSLLPVDIMAGGVWRFDKSGRYTLQTLLATRWNMPTKMRFKRWAFFARALWTCRSEYFDSSSKEISKVPGWTKVSDAYNNIDVSLGCEFSCYRQAGMSLYEQLGFETGGHFVFTYDIEKAARVEKAGGKYSLPTSITFAATLGVKIPRLIPAPSKNGLVLCLPAEIHSTWNGELGVTSDTFAEILLVGWEPQLGVPFLNMHLKRFGVKGGYEFTLRYDTIDRPALVIVDPRGFARMLRDSSVDDFVYLSVEGQLSPAIGFFTKLNVTVGAQFKFYLRDPDFDVALILKAAM